MINVLRVDIERFLMTKSFTILFLLISVGLPAVMRFVMLGMSAILHVDDSVGMNEFSMYPSFAGIYLAVFITLYLYTEAGEGIIRNKMISGKKRHEILFSYCMVNAALAVGMQIISTAVTTLLGICTGAPFEMTSAEIIRQTEVNILAGVSISIFYTALYLCFCTSKAAIVLPATIAIFMKIALIFIMDALYTANGIPKAAGITLLIYRGFDRFIPFAHLTGNLRWDNSSYLAGSVALIVISLAAGILVFRRKDMK